MIGILIPASTTHFKQIEDYIILYMQASSTKKNLFKSSVTIIGIMEAP